MSAPSPSGIGADYRGPVDSPVPEPAGSAPLPAVPRAPAWYARRLLWRALVWAVVLIAAYLAVEFLVGRVDWAAVGSALDLLPWPAGVLLIALLLVRQACSAAPMMFYLPGLRLIRSMQNDLTANLVATFAPTPSDIVVRVSMFRSWGLDPAMGLAASAINSVKFYVIRFGAPVVGLVLLSGQAVDPGLWWFGAASAAVSVAMVVTLVLIARADHLAAWVGRTAGRIGHRFSARVDPERWSQVVVETRAGTARGLRRGLLPSLAELLVMVLLDAVMMLVALRAVGVDAALLPTVAVLGAVLVAYPVTSLPLFGLGVLDALLVGFWVGLAGPELEPAAIAGVLVWRVVTLGVTYLLGLGSLAWWRLDQRRGH